MRQFLESDVLYMRMALDLACSVKGKTFPNPAVGAVIVDSDNNIIGKGATQKMWWTACRDSCLETSW